MKFLIYLPHSYTWRGPAGSCIRIIEAFAAEGVDRTVFVHRARAPIPASADVVEAYQITNHFISPAQSEYL